jgi:hypothetical protein
MNNIYEIPNDHSDYSDYESFDDEQTKQIKELKKCVRNDDIDQLKYLLIEKKYKWYNELIDDAVFEGSFNVINYAIYNIERLHLNYYQGLRNVMYHLVSQRHYKLMKYYFENNILPINIRVIFKIEKTKVFKYFFNKFKYQFLNSRNVHSDICQLISNFCLERININIIKYVAQYKNLKEIIWCPSHIIIKSILKDQKYERLTYILKETRQSPEFIEYFIELLNKYLIENKKKRHYRRFKNLLHIETETYWIEFFKNNNFIKYPILNNIKNKLLNKLNN